MYFLRKHIDEASIYQDRQSQVKAGGCKRPRPAPTPTRSGTPHPSAGPSTSCVPLLYCTRISSILFIARCASMFFRRWMLSSSLCLSDELITRLIRTFSAALFSFPNSFVSAVSPFRFAKATMSSWESSAFAADTFPPSSAICFSDA